LVNPSPEYLLKLISRGKFTSVKAARQLNFAAVKGGLTSAIS